MNLQAFELLFEFAIALEDLGADEVEGSQSLLERKQMFGPPVAVQALGDLLDAGLVQSWVGKSPFTSSARVAQLGHRCIADLRAQSSAWRRGQVGR